MSAAVRTREDIEREIRIKRRERELYVSDEARAMVDEKVDALLEEWAAADAS